MRQILLLRGINVGAHNRIPMPSLRERLTAAGFADVRTYVQSGNVLLSSDASPEELARACEREISAEYGLSINVVARTRDELAEQAVDELADIEGLSPDEAGSLIMKARAHWFEAQQH